MKITNIVRGLALAAAFTVPGMADLLTNGNFDTPGAGCPSVGSFTTLSSAGTCLTGWTINSGTVDYIGTYWQNDGNTTNSVDLNGGSASSISQSFATQVGTTYTVSFALAGNPAGPPPVKMLDVSIDGNVVLSPTFDVTTLPSTLSNMGWKTYTYSFVAASSTTQLGFASTVGGSYGAALDSVSVSATSVPEPSSLGLLVLVGAATFAARRKK